MPVRAGPIPLLLCAVLGLAHAPRAAAQTDGTTTVAAGPRYAADAAKRVLLGEGYRDLWTTPIAVPVLDLFRSAGGLTPVRRGGNLQTRALRFRGADGLEYNFRSVDKELTPALPEFARETLVDQVRQDITSAQLPVAPLVASRLLDAVGVLHPGPRLVVLPDHPALGEFREEYAGMLGTLELHADEGENGEPLFGRFQRAMNTEDMLDEVSADPSQRVDGYAFLAARLMDLFLNDFDRHPGQWRWARFSSGDLRYWTPVPEDRDYAFVDYEGVLIGLIRMTVAPRLVSFNEVYPDLMAMMSNSLALNRRLLAPVPRAAWDSVAAAVQGRLTDEAIAGAAALLPPEYGPGPRERLARILRARRDRLREAAGELYRLMAENVEAHSTDVAERAEIVRAADGSLTVTVRAEEAPPGTPPVFARTFLPEETREVRLYLHGGDDRALVTGGAGDIVLRVLGGGGDDHLEDRAVGPTILYDAEGENRLVAGTRTRIDRRPERQPVREPSLLPRQQRDWGTTQGYAPAGGWRSDAQLLLGAEIAWTRRAFRHHPFAERHALRGTVAPLHGRFGAEYHGRIHRENSPLWLELRAGGANYESFRYFGVGNDSPDTDLDRARVWHRQLRAEALLHFPAGRQVDLFAGPVVRHTDLEVRPGTPLEAASPPGTEPFGQAGLAGGVRVDTRDSPWFPRHGGRLDVQVSAHPPVWSVDGGFGRLEAATSAYFSLPLPLRPVLALRGGGAELWGPFPIHEAARIGGSGSLRGEQYSRFLGDAALFGNAELRVPVTRAEIVVRGDLGVSLLADAGRVYLDGDSPGGWHRAAGGSLWFATPVGSATATVARGESGTRAYLQVGMPF